MVADWRTGWQRPADSWPWHESVSDYPERRRRRDEICFDAAAFLVLFALVVAVAAPCLGALHRLAGRLAFAPCHQSEPAPA